MHTDSVSSESRFLDGRPRLHNMVEPLSLLASPDAVTLAVPWPILRSVSSSDSPLQIPLSLHSDANRLQFAPSIAGWLELFCEWH